MTRRVTRHLSPCIASGWLVALLLLTGCSNILRSGLVNDTSILLPPSTARTIYVQIRNTSENQPSRLMAKGYQVVNDPLGAAYWLQTQVVYCHKAGEGVRPEMVAKAGFGAGIGSGGTPLANAGGLDMDAMGGMFGGSGSGGVNMQALRGMAMGGGAAPDLNAMMRMAMSGRGGYPGMAPPEQNHDSLYLCVADVLVTEQGKTDQPRLYKMRSVAHVLQKKLNIEEATPIVREKFGASITGAF